MSWLVVFWFALGQPFAWAQAELPRAVGSRFWWSGPRDAHLVHGIGAFWAGPSGPPWGVVFYTHMNGYLGIPGMAGIRRAHGYHGYRGYLNQAGAGPAPGPGRMGTPGMTGIRRAHGYPGYPMGIRWVSHGHPTGISPLAWHRQV